MIMGRSNRNNDVNMQVIYLGDGDGQTIFPDANVVVTPHRGAVLSFQVRIRPRLSLCVCYLCDDPRFLGTQCVVCVCVCVECG